MRPNRRRSITAALTTALLGLGALLPALVVAPAAAAELPTIVISEVESNGDVNDWIELANTGEAAVDVSGWVLRDDKDDSAIVIPEATVIEPGAFAAFDTDDGSEHDFGLGKADMARLFLADGVTLVDSRSWEAHALTTFGLCSDGFRETTSPTKGAVNDCDVDLGASIRINEVESSGGAPGDWIELSNIGTAVADLSGLVLMDDSTKSLTIADGTLLAAGAFIAIDVEAGFGLGGADSARLFEADGATLIDSYSWTAHAATSYGRCPDGVGAFAETAAVTKGAANDCSPAVVPSLVINEIESNGDPSGDWVELFNTGTSDVDVSGYRVIDNDASHTAGTLPDDSVVPAGGHFVIIEGVLGFGLGTNDSVTLFAADGVTVVDAHAWEGHSPTTLARCPDGTGDFAVSTSSTKGAANDCSAPIRINEVESTDGEPGDWVELINVGVDPVDVSGFEFKDADDDHSYVIPSTTTIAAGGHLVLEEAQFGFGLGKADSVRLFDGVGGTLIDSYTWASAAATTFGRCPDGTGDFATTAVITKGTANVCAGEIVAGAWPGGPQVAAADVNGFFGENMSGLAFEPSVSGVTGGELLSGGEDGTLWASKNGPGMLYKLDWNGSAWVPATASGWGGGALLHYADGTGEPDAEGVALTAAGVSGGVFVATERDNQAGGVSRPSVLRFDVATGITGGAVSASTEWNLAADLPPLGANLGLEGIAWVPDSFLTAGGFIDESTGQAYDPSDYAGHGSGLFFVGAEATGGVYAFALNDDGSHHLLATIASGFPSVMELEFDAASSALWAICDDGCSGRSALLTLEEGAFAAGSHLERPAGMANLNNEGFAISAACVDGARTVVWSDDTGTAGTALRNGTLDCTGGTDGGSGEGDGDGGDGGSGGGTGGDTGGEVTIPAAVPGDSLTDANRGSVSAPTTARQGQTIMITVGPGHVGERVHGWIYSTPSYLGAATVSAANTVSLTVPSGLAPGAHRIAVLDASGAVIGWAAISVTALAATGTDASGTILLAGLLLLGGAALVAVRRIAAGRTRSELVAG